MRRSLLLNDDLGHLDVVTGLLEGIDHHLEESILWILDLIEDVHGSLVELSLINLLTNLELDKDFLAELLAIWLHEIEVSDSFCEHSILENLDWNGDGELLVTLNREIDW